MKPPRVFAISGYSGSGKTTLIERCLPLIRARGVSVAVIKHTHHDFDVDKPGKDSWRFREAGASPVLLSSDHRTALLIEHRDAPPTLDALLALLPPVELVLIEGYKREPLPRLEVHRQATGKPWLWPDDPAIRAVASDEAPTGINPPAHFHLDDISAITDYVLAHADRRPIA